MPAKLKKIIDTNIFKISVFIIFAVFSSYTVSCGASFLRTLPFVLVLPAVSTLFYNRKLLSAFACFVCAAIFLTVESTDILNTAIFSVFAFLFSGLGMLIKRFFVTAYVSARKRVFCLVTGIILLLIGVFSYSLVFGNPVSFAVNRAQNLDYIRNLYGKELSQAQNYTWYNMRDGRYYTNVSFTDTARMNADISSGKIAADGYSNYYEYKALSDRREELAQMFSENVKGDCAVRINTNETETYGDTTERENMVFDVAFYAQLAEKEAFEKACEKYITALSESGFVCKKINFYGGFADEFLYKLPAEYPFTITSESIGQSIQPFEEKAFDRYYNELDYADGWSYGE